jgi:hypothetical protein
MNLQILSLMGICSLPAMLGGCVASPYAEYGQADPEQVAAMETMTLQQALAEPESAPSPPGMSPRPELPALATPPIDDLPVPAGFKLKESESRNFESPLARFIDHTYQGRADKFSVVRFYGRHMPQHGWKLRSSEMIRGAFTIHYEKGGEQAIVRITQNSESVFTSGTTVALEVHPVGGQFNSVPAASPR